MKIADLVNITNPYQLVRIKAVGGYHCLFFGQCEEIENKYLEMEVFGIETDIDENYSESPLLDIYIK